MVRRPIRIALSLEEVQLILDALGEQAQAIADDGEDTGDYDPLMDRLTDQLRKHSGGTTPWTTG